MKKNNMIKDIIETLGTTTNFHKLIKLSEKYDEIDINKYLDKAPEININFEYSDKDGSDYYIRSITSLTSFKLNDGQEYSDINFFFKNIHNVVEFVSSGQKLSVMSGEYYIGDDGFRSIEFELHNIKDSAINDTFSLYGTIITKEEHKRLIRKAKFNKLNNVSKSLNDLVKELKNKYYYEISKKKEEERLKIEFPHYNNDLHYMTTVC